MEELETLMTKYNPTELDFLRAKALIMNYKSQRQEAKWQADKMNIVLNLEKHFNTKEQKSWGAVLEYVREKLSANNSRLLKCSIILAYFSKYFFSFMAISTLILGFISDIR